MRNIAGRQLRCVFFCGALSVAAIGVAGCSSEMSRFSENPNGNPYTARAPSYQPAPAPMQPTPVPMQPTRAAAVERQPLPQAPSQYAPQSYTPQYAALQYEQPQYPPPAPQTAPPQYPPPQYVPPPYMPPVPRTTPDLTGAVHGGGNGDQGGATTAVVAPGDTVDAIARRYGVSAQAVMQANNITNPAALVPGQRLVIPRYVVNGTGAKLAHAAAPRAPSPVAVAPAPAPAPHMPVASSSSPVASASPVAPAPAPPTPAMAGSSAQTLLPAPPVHTVGSGDTLGKIAHRYRVGVKEIAVANGIAPETPLRVGAQLTIPVKVVATPPRGALPGKPQPGAPVLAQAKPVAAYHAPPPAAPTPPKVASSEPAANVRLASPVETSPEEAGPNGAPAFRWPARGRIINNYGAKVNGATNDGIDLAVPEGTQVRAADDGVVAYAGNELKGYGNLVLVRHSNGFVTAYANASEVLVKRNDQVRKGQVILKSGQTGNAPTPQLHFEIRKNSAPVDPMQYLPADKTASAPL